MLAFNKWLLEWHCTCASQYEEMLTQSKKIALALLPPRIQCKSEVQIISRIIIDKHS
jgi:hypothetical protein